MVLPLVIIEEKTELNKYTNYQGFFVTDKGELCYKPVNISNDCYNMTSGETFEYNNELVYKAYFEGGMKKLRNLIGEEKGIFEGWKRKVHPSYGMLYFGRMQTNPPRALFGSSIKHSNPIIMKVCHADLERGINRDWYHAEGKIVEVEMSQSQFAEAITSLNVGDGVPCTLRFTELDGYIPECDFTSKVEQFKGEFSNQLSGVQNDLKTIIKEVEDILETRKTLRKSDKEKILSALYKVQADVGCNAEYVLDSFNEQMDKTMTEAKGEIESFIQNQVQRFAADALIEKAEDEEELKKLVTLE